MAGPGLGADFDQLGINTPLITWTRPLAAGTYDLRVSDVRVAAADAEAHPRALEGLCRMQLEDLAGGHCTQKRVIREHLHEQRLVLAELGQRRLRHLRKSGIRGCGQLRLAREGFTRPAFFTSVTSVESCLLLAATWTMFLFAADAAPPSLRLPRHLAAATGRRRRTLWRQRPPRSHHLRLPECSGCGAG